MTTQNTTPMVGIKESPTDVPRWAIEAALESRIEAHRYLVDDECDDRVLARYEEVDTLFPSFEVLELLGVNVAKLADALDNGLDARLFGLVLENGLDIEGFNQTLESGIDIPTFNSGMEHLVDQQKLVALHSDPAERALHAHDECGCNE